MKQTAVEWLAKELLREHPVLTNHDAIQQAKEMEKQQIVDAYENGIQEGILRYSSEEYNLEYYNTAEQYYNETFNNK
jgi:hypothetical protein